MRSSPGPTKTLFAALMLVLGGASAAIAATDEGRKSALTSTAYYGAARAHVGNLMSAAGDVNGDRRPDVITTIGVRQAVVVFGAASTRDVDINRIGRRGFRIRARGIAGGIQSVSGAGDVNGDGRSDLIVGTPQQREEGRASPGSAYVIFGKKSSATVNLDRLGFRGFRIVGERRSDFAGAGVAGMGDLNGDGLQDVVIGAPRAEAGDRFNAGAVYTVFGRRSTTTIQLSTLGSSGQKVVGARSNEQVGNAVSRAPDMNGDHLDELVIGAARSNSGGRGSGGTYVVYGRRSAGAVNLAELGSRGFSIRGAAAREGVGFAVTGLRDVNGDRLGDVAVGAPGARNSGRASGSAYVVFGRPNAGRVELARLSTSGFRLDGVRGDNAGFALASASDQNRDGRGELIVGAPGAEVDGEPIAGTAYVVYGTGARRPRRLDRLGNGGFRLSRMQFLGTAGASVAEAGDWDGDGRAEIVVGAPGASYDGRMGSGAAYVFSGL